MRPAPLTRLREAGIPVHDSLERAVRCMAALAEFGEVAARRPSAPAPVRRQAAIERIWRAAATRIAASCSNMRGAWRCRRPACRWRRPCSPPTPSRTAEMFSRLGSVPLAMKVVSPGIIHKTEAGGVVLGVAGADEARETFARILESANRAGQLPISAAS